MELTATEQYIVERFAKLPPHLQQHVLGYIDGLGAGGRIGVPGKALMDLAGTMSAEDADDMMRAIEELRHGNPVA